MKDSTDTDPVRISTVDPTEATVLGVALKAGWEPTEASGFLAALEYLVARGDRALVALLEEQAHRERIIDGALAATREERNIERMRAEQERAKCELAVSLFRHLVRVAGE